MGFSKRTAVRPCVSLLNILKWHVYCKIKVDLRIADDTIGRFNSVRRYKRMEGESMKSYVMENAPQENWLESNLPFEEFYSVEIPLDGLEFLHQFKIWNIDSETLFVVVKEESEILPCLRVGDTIKMKYYIVNPTSPPKYLLTKIKHITKENQGRFKGHVVIGLDILEELPERNIH